MQKESGGERDGFALNDVVLRAEWNTSENWRVKYTATFIGASGDQTLHFRIRRDNIRVTPEKPEEIGAFNPVGQSHLRGYRSLLAPSAFNVPQIPTFWEAKIPFNNTDPAVIAWREGPSEVRLRYFTLADGVLFEIDAPPKVKGRQIGFRAAIEENPADSEAPRE